VSDDHAAASSCSRRRFLQAVAAIAGAGALAGCQAGVAGQLRRSSLTPAGVATLAPTQTPLPLPTPTPTPTPDPNRARFEQALPGLPAEVQAYLRNDPRFAHPDAQTLQVIAFLLAAQAADLVGLFTTPTNVDPQSRRGRDLEPWDGSRQIRMLETGAYRAVAFGSRPGFVGVTSYLVPDLDISFANRILAIAERRFPAVFAVVDDIVTKEPHIAVQYEPFPGATSFTWGLSLVLDDDIFEVRDGDATLEHIFCHEFAHCLQYPSLALAPVWFAEGSADYVASAARDANIPRGASGYAAAADGGKVTLNLTTGRVVGADAYAREGGNGHLFLSDLALALGAGRMGEALRACFSTAQNGSGIVATFQSVADAAGDTAAAGVRAAIAKWT
jgi:hypothetical protein